MDKQDSKFFEKQSTDEQAPYRVICFMCLLEADEDQSVLLTPGFLGPCCKDKIQ